MLELIILTDPTIPPTEKDQISGPCTSNIYLLSQLLQILSTKPLTNRSVKVKAPLGIIQPLQLPQPTLPPLFKPIQLAQALIPMRIINICVYLPSIGLIQNPPHLLSGLHCDGVQRRVKCINQSGSSIIIISIRSLQTITKKREYT